MKRIILAIENAINCQKSANNPSCDDGALARIFGGGIESRHYWELELRDALNEHIEKQVCHILNDKLKNAVNSC